MSLAAEAGFEVIGEASTCQEALEIVQRCSPHVLIVDLDLPELEGLELARKVSSISSRTAVILISMQDDILTCLQVKESGAVALLPKSMPVAHLLSAIREISAATRRNYLLTHIPKPPFESKVGRAFDKNHFVVSLKYHKR
jgi:DNA-binding NarL/FixJ family response regulator